MSTTIDIEDPLICTRTHNVAKYVGERSDVMRVNYSQCNRGEKVIDQLRLRFLTGDDIAALKVLCNDWFPIKYPDSWYRLIAIDDRFFSLAATLEQKIVAILIAEIKPRCQVSKEDSDLLASSFKKDSKVAYILSLGVHKAYRRQGVATYLLHNFLTSICTQENSSCTEVKAIYLHVLSTNSAAIQFYEQHKFKCLHFLPAYYVIDGAPRDGYSYVLYINGGKPPITIVGCIFDLLNFFSCLRFCSYPSRLVVNLNKLFSYVMTWPNFSPFVSKTRQCHDL